MLFFITFVTYLLVPVLSRYHGDSCTDGDNQGICIPLSQCQHLMDEITAAGSPMPTHIRNRLHDVGCGFTNDEPLVCCSFDQSSVTRPPVAATSEIDVLANWGNTGGTKRPRPDKPNTNPNSISPITNINDGPQDVTNHPNLRLLPKSCGVILEGNKIVGGNRTQLYEMPWMVILSYDVGGEKKLSCGGTLISTQYVLTAAHCLQLGAGVTLSSVILGEYDVRTDPDCEVIAGRKSCASRVVNARIEEVISHPGYRRQTLFDDIALIRLAEPVTFAKDNIKPICLPITPILQRDDLDGLISLVAGWGITEERIQAPVLMSVGLPIIANDVCQAAYRRNKLLLHSSQMCAGGIKDKASCGGDSGGPLLYPGILGSGGGGVRYIQRGIVSFGLRTCGGGGGLPGVYTRVSHYMKWILDNMRR